jgi:holo-[acyl-carrier protein] synthase
MEAAFEPGGAPAGGELQLRVGVDLVSVERMRSLLTRYAAAEERLFTEGERAYCRGKRRAHEHLAARFAAKEAVGKAMGTGIGRGLSWQAVEVLLEESGRPHVELHGEARAWADRHGLVQLDVSLSHTGELAVAYAAALVGAPPALEL